MSEFWQAMGDEFGDGYARSLARDLVLTPLRDRTAEQALRDGVPAREVWAALCEAMDVPANRRYGVGQLPQKD
jgi:hypothetical protein